MLKRMHGSDYAGYLVGRWMVITRTDGPDSYGVEMVNSDGEPHRLLTVDMREAADLFMETVVDALHLTQYNVSARGEDSSP